MNAQPFIVKETIRTAPVDTLLAEDANTKEAIGYKQGTAEELCEYLDLLHANYAVPYRVTLSSSATAKRGPGRPKDERRAQPVRFVFVLRGGAGAAPAAPVNAAPAAPVVPLELAGQSAENRVRAELLKEKADALEKELDELYAELDEQGEDLEAAEAQLNAAPPVVPPVLKWWEREEIGKLVLELGKPLGHALTRKLLGDAPAAPAAAAAVAAVSADGLSETERRLVAAARNARKMHGDAVVDAELGPLITTYADMDPATISAQGGQA